MPPFIIPIKRPAHAAAGTGDNPYKNKQKQGFSL